MSGGFGIVYLLQERREKRANGHFVPSSEPEKGHYSYE